MCQAVWPDRFRTLGLPIAGKMPVAGTGLGGPAGRPETGCAGHVAAAPPGSEAMQWCLLTSLPVEAVAAAEIVRHSWPRGRIEDCFRTGKADCQVERLAVLFCTFVRSIWLKLGRREATAGRN